MNIAALSTDEELNAFRKFVLTAAGHDVTVVNTEKDAVALAGSGSPYDIVLLCHHLPAATGRQVVRLLRQTNPATRIVFISHIYGEWPEVEADRYIVGADGPDALTRVLQELASTPA